MDLCAVIIITWIMIGPIAALTGVGTQLLVIPLQIYFGKWFGALIGVIGLPRCPIVG